MGHHHRHEHHGNPEDLERYLAKLEDPARAAWQRPDEVVAALGLAAGQTVCEVGAGPGYFSLRLGRAVGPTGQVYAVEVEPKILAVLGQRLAASEVRNVTPVLGGADDVRVPPGSSDLVLIVDTFHHFPDGVAFLRSLATRLKPGGRLANIDFHKRELPVGPPVEHLVAREELLRQAEAAGFALVAEHTFLPHQYFLVFGVR